VLPKMRTVGTLAVSNREILRKDSAGSAAAGTGEWIWFFDHLLAVKKV
jgi:hypothetical protein